MQILEILLEKDVASHNYSGCKFQQNYVFYCILSSHYNSKVDKSKTQSVSRIAAKATP